MIDKEYIQETLDKLKKDLKDINTYTSFKNGTYFYDLGFFQGSTLIDELDKYKNIVDELILTGLASSMSIEDFEHMWETAYNKKYNPDDIKEIAKRKGILKGE